MEVDVDVELKIDELISDEEDEILEEHFRKEKKLKK